MNLARIMSALATWGKVSELKLATTEPKVLIEGVRSMFGSLGPVSESDALAWLDIARSSGEESLKAWLDSGKAAEFLQAALRQGKPGRSEPIYFDCPHCGEMIRLGANQP